MNIRNINPPPPHTPIIESFPANGYDRRDFGNRRFLNWIAWCLSGRLTFPVSRSEHISEEYKQ